MTKTDIDYKNFTFSFKKNNLDELFHNLTENPLGLEKKDFRLTLSTLYQIVEDEFEPYFVTANKVLRNTNFYLFQQDGKIFAFVTPTNNFDFFVKSKGSLYRFSSTNKEVNGREEIGYIVPIDIIWEYFAGFESTIDVEYASESFKLLNILTQFVKKAIAKLYFLPKVTKKQNTFSISYELYSSTDEMVDILHQLYSLDFKNCTAFDHAVDVLIENYLNYQLFQFLGHKASKFKDLMTSVYFIKRGEAKRYYRSLDVAEAIEEWLDEIYIGKYPVLPRFDIEKITEDDFILTICVRKNDKKPLEEQETIPFGDIYKMDKVFDLNGDLVVNIVEKQLNYALRYYPEMEPLFEDEDNLKLHMNLNEVYKLMAQTAYYLNKAGIDISFPPNFGNIVVPRASINAKVKTARQAEIIEFLNGNTGSISLSSIFDFSYKIAIGNEMVSVEEFEKLVHNAKGIVAFKDKYILIDEAEIKKILDKVKNPKIDKVTKMQMLHAALSGNLEEYEFDYDAAFTNIIKDLTKTVEITVPETLNGELRPYQFNGLKWLYTNTTKGFGSCIADDMGLGKTVQVISLLLKLKEEGKLKNPAIVVCPTTLMGNWLKELQMFAPTIKASVYHGAERKLDLKADIIITTYAILRIDIEEIKKNSWSVVVIDEAQNIKNPDTSQTIAVKELKAETKIAMTGTPVENKLTELWSIFDFINKGYLGSIREFQKSYAIPIERFKQYNRADKLKLSISPFLLRRLKTDKSIINDLPEKLVIDDYCYLTNPQAALYEKTLNTIMDEMHNSSGINRRGIIFKLITALKQICNHPYQYLKYGDMSKDISGKTEKFISLLSQIMENNEKVIAFTQYKEMGHILETIIKNELGIAPLFFHGSLNPVQRQNMLNQFEQDDNSRIMLLSLKAGGTGLNLTGATNVIHYDLWWNPAVEDQATDRSYRIGQTKNVMVHRLVTIGTFEEKIDEMIKTKKELVNLAVFEGEKNITELTDEEIYNIFSLSG